MKLNYSKYKFRLASARRGIVVMAFLTLTGSVLTSTLAQLDSPKKITAVQVGKLDGGSRVSVFADSGLNDYEAFRRGDRFYVKFPRAAFAAARPSFTGMGFQDIHVLEANGAVILSFKLQPGANARVDQHPKRLDVIFSVPGQASVSVAKSEPNRNSSDSVPGVVVLQNSRPRTQNTADAAGPMPPDTPINNRPRLVTPEFSGRSDIAQVAQRSHTETNPSPKSYGATDVRPSAVKSTDVKSTPTLASGSENKAVTDPWKPENKTEGFSSTTTPATQTNTPSQSSSAWQPGSRQPLPASSTTTSAGWKRRKDLAVQWVLANKTASGIAAAMLLGSIVLGCGLLYRRRRTTGRTARQRVPGVKPKSSPNEAAAEVLAHENGEIPDDVHDHYVPEFDMSQNDLDGSPAELEHQDEEVFHWVGDTEVVASNGNEPWVHQTSTIPNYPMNNEESEREVFEL